MAIAVINTEKAHNVTNTEREILTMEEIRSIVTARIAASNEVEDLLAIIDRITGTKWVMSGDH